MIRGVAPHVRGRSARARSAARRHGRARRRGARAAYAGCGRPAASGCSSSLYGVAWFGAYNVALNLAEHTLDAGTTAMIVNIGPILIALGAGAVPRRGHPEVARDRRGGRVPRRPAHRARHQPAPAAQRRRPDRRALVAARRRDLRDRRARAEAGAPAAARRPGDLDRMRDRHDRLPPVRRAAGLVDSRTPRLAPSSASSTSVSSRPRSPSPPGRYAL